MENYVVKKINGKNYGFKFNVLTFQLFSDMSGVEFGDMGTHFQGKPFGSILKMISAGYEVYNEGKGLSEYKMADLIDEMSQEDFQDIWNSFEINFTKYVSKFEKKNPKGKQ